MNNIELYVINLDKDIKRLKDIHHILKPNQFTRIQGIYGQDIDCFEDIFITSQYLTPKNVLGSSLSHKKAITHFLQHSKKEYALVLEDDAIPITEHYMTEVVTIINNAPKDWDIIKLDSWPHYSTSFYTTFPSLYLTAYVVNKASAKKWQSYKIVYYPDIYMWFFQMKIYNSPTLVFRQIWDENNQSNTRSTNPYNPLHYICESLKFNMLRIPYVDIEWTIADLTLLFVFVIFFKIKIKNKK